MLETPMDRRPHYGTIGDSRMVNQQRSLELRLSWLGGIIDGEGMVTASYRGYKDGKGRKQQGYTPKITVVNTDMKIIDEVVSVLTETGIPHYVQTKAGKGTWKTKYEVIVAGIKRCLIALPLLTPYIVAKQYKANALLQFCQNRMLVGKKAPYSTVDFELLASVRNSNTLRDFTSDLRIPLDLKKIKSELHGDMQRTAEMSVPA